jgi:hypothetical protein
MVEGFETCDGGNALSCDSCSGSCSIEQNLRWVESVDVQTVAGFGWFGDALWWVTDEGRLLRLSAEGQVEEELQLPHAASFAPVAIDSTSDLLAMSPRRRSAGSRARRRLPRYL